MLTCVNAKWKTLKSLGAKTMENHITKPKGLIEGSKFKPIPGCHENKCVRERFCAGNSFSCHFYGADFFPFVISIGVDLTNNGWHFYLPISFFINQMPF
jgi:hypothetical protein